MPRLMTTHFHHTKLFVLTESNVLFLFVVKEDIEINKFVIISASLQMNNSGFNKFDPQTKHIQAQKVA